MQLKNLLLLGAAPLVAGVAGAGETCHSVDIVLQPTNWASTLDVPRFDPAAGVLTGIELTLSGSAQGSASIESLDNSPTTVSTQFQATLTLTRPDLSVLVVTTPLAAFTDDLSAFDGVVDFDGTSGTMHLGIMATAQETAVSPPPASDLTLFTGPAGNPGVISLPVSAIGSSTANGSGNLITQFQTSASASLTVCYTFALDCNGNGVPDEIDVNQGTSNDANQDGIPDECQPGTKTICTGDGVQNGGADCPCMNNGNPGEGCDNGTGAGALMAASGVPSVSNDTLELTVSGIQPTTPGFFFFGYDVTNAGLGAPFGNGLRCIDFSVPVLKQDGGGTIPVPNSPPLSVLLGIQPGVTSYFQYWYRNPTGPCAGLSANTTNAIEVVWGL